MSALLGGVDSQGAEGDVIDKVVVIERPILFTPENVRKILDGTKGRGDRGDPRHLAKGHDGVP